MYKSLKPRSATHTLQAMTRYIYSRLLDDKELFCAESKQTPDDGDTLQGCGQLVDDDAVEEADKNKHAVGPTPFVQRQVAANATHTHIRSADKPRQYTLVKRLPELIKCVQKQVA